MQRSTRSRAGLFLTRIAGLVAGCLLTLTLAVPTGASAPARSFSCAASTPGTTANQTPGSTRAVPTQQAASAEVNPPGDIPDNQAFVTYHSTAGGYQIAMPEGWARAEAGPNVSFTDKLHQFGVTLSCVSGAPTVQRATSVDVPALKREAPAFELVKVAAVTLSAGSGVLIQYRMNSAPDPVTNKQIRLDADRYEVAKNGVEAAITLAVPAGSDNVDVSKKVAESFAWTA